MAAFFLSEAILHIRNSCPLFEGRVFGVQSFTAATRDKDSIAVPAAYIVPMSDTAEEDHGLDAQRVTERFAVIVAADNSKDPRLGRGYSSEATLRTARSQLVNVLMGWTPVTMKNLSPVRYSRGQHLFMNNARIWHQYEFTCSYFMAPDRDLSEDELYKQIELIIRNYWPEVSASQVKRLMTNHVPGATIDPRDADTYDVLYEALYGTNPNYIVSTPVPPGDGPERMDPSAQMFGEHREVDI